MWVVAGVIEGEAVAQPAQSPSKPAPGHGGKGGHDEAGAEVNAKVSDGAADGSKDGEARPGIDGGTVGGPRIIGGNVDDLRVRRSHVDVALIVRDLFLRGGLEIAGRLGALAHGLDRAEDVLRLVVVRVAELGGPGKVTVQVGEDLRERGEGLHTGVPWLRVCSGGDFGGRGIPH